VLKLFVGWMNLYANNSALKLDSYFKKQDEIKQQLVEFIESENDLNVN
jgi:hypothetical protein